EIEKAMALVGRLIELAEERDGGYLPVLEMFEITNARMYLRFQKVPWGKRLLNKLASGVVTFGDAPPPIKLYDGPTSRKVLKNQATGNRAGRGQKTKKEETNSSPPSQMCKFHEEGESLGNQSRGER